MRLSTLEQTSWQVVGDSRENEYQEMNSYVRLGLMVGTSVVLMYGITYLTSYEIVRHAAFSETRGSVALMMGSAMLLVMILFGWRMYEQRLLNAALLGVAVVAFGIFLYLLRSQATVDDVDYMEAMIPHHSIAILTSKRAHLSDPRVRDLADRIIEAQELEIAEMRALIGDLRGGRTATPEVDGR